MGRATAAARETEADVYLPFERFVDQTTLALSSRALMSMIELDGVAFETADPGDLDAYHDELNTLIRNVADERLSLWSHVIRRRVGGYPEGTFSNAFAAGLDAKFKARIGGEALYRNRLIVSVVWMPRDLGAQAAGFLKNLGKARARDVEVDAEDLKALHDTVASLAAGLGRWGARVLSLVEAEGMWWSEPSEVLQVLLGGRAERKALTMGRVGSAVYAERVIFGRERVEIRREDRSLFAGVFSLKEYPAVTQPGLLAEVLSLPFELTVSQSFSVIGKGAGRELLQRRQNQMVSGQDAAVSQIAGLRQAADELESNVFVMGEHHLSVAVFGASSKEVGDAMAKVRPALTGGGAVVVAEDLGLEAAWWAQLPGNWKYRARSGAITSRNFAGLSPFYSYPQGRREGNHWGPAVAILKTTSGGPFYFSFHVRDLGNTVITGPSGSGKTVAVNFFLSQLLKSSPRMVVFDKDRGMDLFVRAAGGTYLPLKSGVPTGCAPFLALDAGNAADRVFLGAFVAQLVGGNVSAAEASQIDVALQQLALMPIHLRAVGHLRTYLTGHGEGSVSARLERWERGGPLGWVFDNEADQLGLEALAVETGGAGPKARLLGYDMTEFLDNQDIRAPLMSYLFRRIETLMTGERICIVIDEFWKALSDPTFRAVIADKLKTIRKQNGFLVLATQSPRDVVGSGISHTIVEQCPTQIYLPNSQGRSGDYVGGMGLTGTEFELITRGIAPSSRRMLIKQGGSSVVAELNLNGFEDELAILSGRTETVELCEQVRSQVGEDPEIWVPELHRRRRGQ